MKCPGKLSELMLQILKKTDPFEAQLLEFIKLLKMRIKYELAHVL